MNESSYADRVAGRYQDPRFLLSVLEASGDCIKVLDLDANLLFMTTEGQRIMEVSDFNAISGCPWPDFWQDQGNIDAKAAVAEALAGREGRFQGHAATMKGTRKFWDVRVSPIFGNDGKPAQLLSVSRDITPLKVAEEQREFLMLELSHRVKNTLATVQAIASQTLLDGNSMQDARDAFSGRLVALSGAHDILLQANWKEANLRSLIEAAEKLHAPEGNKMRADGPDVPLGPKAALAFSLALHELGTNALK